MRKAGMCVVWMVLGSLTASAASHVLNNLRAFGDRLDVGDPTMNAQRSSEGPKGIATADFDSNGLTDIAVANVDGTVTVYFCEENGAFSAPLHLQAGWEELRGIVCADLTGDGKPDIATAAPYLGQISLFVNAGGRSFASRTNVGGWRGVRNLATGDFDGDGLTDLVAAGPERGVQEYRSLGGGQFSLGATLSSLNHEDEDFPKPVYALAAWRPTGAARDELVVTHANSDRFWILAAPTGALQVASIVFTGTTTNFGVHALDVGAISRPLSNGLPDLVTAKRDLGTVEVWEGVASSSRFADRPRQTIRVPGGPRALQIVDLDGDGWNDLVVVLRNFDCMMSYRNSNGTLVAASENPVGRSPREVAIGEFNRDGYPDVVVMNRSSADLSVLRTYPGTAAFAGLDQLYPSCGEVSGLAVVDLNSDGRDDVIQLHRSSDDFSVRIAGPNGLLSEPTFYAMGSLPSAMSVADTDSDGHLDVVTANLGRPFLEPGSISVRSGLGDGRFGPERRGRFGTNETGRLFAVVSADFNLDGIRDFAVGFLDCRIAFFQGLPDGSLLHTRTHFFTFEARTMVAADFDQDGDTDLAGAGYAGDVVVIENLGDLLTTPTLKRTDYPPPTAQKFGTHHMVAVDRNHDGDPDLLIASGHGAMIYLGGPGVTFTLQTDTLRGSEFAASGVAADDFDNNGSLDVAVCSRFDATVTILTPIDEVNSTLILKADVPAGGFLACGDLDGDGMRDLVGAGNTLWTAVSGRAAQVLPPANAPIQRPGITNSPVINEFLALNDQLPLEMDGGRTSDWIELYNGTSADMVLAGWQLRLARPASTNTFVFPASALLPRRGYLVLVCSDRVRSPLHTGFALPSSGGTLSLINPAGIAVDTISYGPQQSDISLARYRDALHSFALNPFPSPGAQNVDNGPIDPVARIEGFNRATFAPNQPIQFFATGFDDVGLISVCLRYRRLDIPDSNIHRVVLYDDGMHDDGGFQDGKFAGYLDPGLPAGAEIQFYVEAVDLSDQMTTVPDDPVFAAPGETVGMYTLSMQAPGLPLEISEFVADNKNGLADEGNGRPDWIEIRNCGAAAVNLDGIGVSPRFFGNGQRYAFPPGTMLNPAEHFIVFCDDEPTQGSRHAPFTLEADGGEIVLTATSATGGRMLLDSISYGAQKTDEALARLGCRGEWYTLTPTPGAQNVFGSHVLRSVNGKIVLAYPTAIGSSYVAESSSSISGPWTPQPASLGTGLEQVVSETMTGRRFFRVRRN